MVFCKTNDLFYFTQLILIHFLPAAAFPLVRYHHCHYLHICLPAMFGTISDRLLVQLTSTSATVNVCCCLYNLCICGCCYPYICLFLLLFSVWNRFTASVITARSCCFCCQPAHTVGCDLWLFENFSRSHQRSFGVATTNSHAFLLPAHFFQIFYGLPLLKSHWSSASPLPFIVFSSAFSLTFFVYFLYGFQCIQFVCTVPRSRLACNKCRFQLRNLNPVACRQLPAIVNFHSISCTDFCLVLCACS